MGTRVCLIDGTYELFRAFFAVPSSRTQAGEERGALFAWGRSLRALQRGGEFSHYAVAFDTVIESFRNELFSGYKTGEGIDPDLFAQFQPAEELTEALGFAVLSLREFEADDGLATLAARFAQEERVEQVVIASPDKDLMQCVQGQRVITWDRKRQIFYDEEAVEEKLGVRPRSVPDFLALVGDAADGIPGIPRWGARSSAQVLKKYEHLEHIPRRVEDWQVQVRGAAGLVQQLIAHEEEVLLYRRLATLRTDVPEPRQLDDFLYRGEQEKKLASWEQRWERQL